MNFPSPSDWVLESTVDEVVITWPGGREQRMTGIPVDQLTVVEEATPKGRWRRTKPGKNPRRGPRATARGPRRSPPGNPPGIEHVGRRIHVQVSGHPAACSRKLNREQIGGAEPEAILRRKQVFGEYHIESGLTRLVERGEIGGERILNLRSNSVPREASSVETCSRRPSTSARRPLASPRCSGILNSSPASGWER